MGSCKSSQPPPDIRSIDEEEEAKRKRIANLTDEEKCQTIRNTIDGNYMKPDDIKAMIELLNGLELPDPSNTGKRPLHVAAQVGHFAAVDLLIKMKANVNAQDDLLNTPLHYALDENNFDCSALLKKAGADENITNDNNHPARSGASGKTFYALAALRSAEMQRQADIALTVCNMWYDQFENLEQFQREVKDLKRRLDKDGLWDHKLESKTQEINRKISTKETRKLEQENHKKALAMKKEKPQQNVLGVPICWAALNDYEVSNVQMIFCPLRDAPNDEVAEVAKSMQDFGGRVIRLSYKVL